ncbi:MAG: hypothetical protein AB7R55_14940 [Gemmatimonadales bacterium]
MRDRWGRLMAAIAFAPIFAAALWLLGLELLLKQRWGAGRGRPDPREEAVVRAYRTRRIAADATLGRAG